MQRHVLLLYRLCSLPVQILMSVNWRYIHAIPMPTALTQRAALSAHVGKALKAMGSTVQVQSTFYTSPIMHIKSINPRKMKPITAHAAYIICLVTLFVYVDISECERELDDCDPNANCINIYGSYSCICNTGFTGDGFTCAG